MADYQQLPGKSIFLDVWLWSLVNEGHSSTAWTLAYRVLLGLNEKTWQTSTSHAYITGTTNSSRNQKYSANRAMHKQTTVPEATSTTTKTWSFPPTQPEFCARNLSPLNDSSEHLPFSHLLLLLLVCDGEKGLYYIAKKTGVCLILLVLH